MAFKYKNDPAAPAPGKAAPGAPAKKPPERIVSIVTEKNGSVYHSTTTYTSGLTKETWNVDGAQACKAPHSDSYLYITKGNPLGIDYSTTDFPELTWIGMDNYVGVAGQDKKVFAFEGKNTDRRPTTGEQAEYNVFAAEFKREADQKGGTAAQKEAMAKQLADQYIKRKFGDSKSRVLLDIATQLPLEYDDGDSIRNYYYTSKPGPSSATLEAIQEIQYWRSHGK